MDTILQEIIAINEEYEQESADFQESTASFPSEDLPSDIWDKTEDSYVLKPELKAMILDALSKYPNIPLLDAANSIKVVGSIGTNLYDEDADIDVHIEPKPEYLEGKSEEELQEIQKDVMNWFKNERDENGWYVNQHPLEVYYQLNPIQDYFSDTVYDLLSDTWLKPVKKYPMDYNPYSEYGDLFKELDDLAAPADVLFGKIHRATVDVLRLQEQNHPDTLETQISAIRNSILALKECKESWRNVRRRNSAEVPSELPEDPSTLEHPEEWKHDNNLFKLLDMAGYFAAVNKLSSLLNEEDELESDKVKEIPEILSEFYAS